MNQQEIPEVRLRYPVGCEVFHHEEWWYVAEGHLFNETHQGKQENRGNPYNRYILKQKGYGDLGMRYTLSLFEYLLYEKNSDFPRQKKEPIYRLNDEVVNAVLAEYYKRNPYRSREPYNPAHTVYDALIVNYRESKDLYALATFTFGIPWERVRELQAECVEKERRQEAIAEIANLSQEMGNY